MINTSQINQNAVKTIKNFVLSYKPTEKTEIKVITHELATAAIGAMLSVHKSTEVLEYLKLIENFIYHQTIHDHKILTPSSAIH